MPQFTGGPSVRVNPNVQVEFKWNTDVAWFGKVEIFDTPTSTTPIFTQPAVDGAGNRIQSTQQTVIVPVQGPVTANTTLYFKVTAEDPGDPSSTIASPSSGPSTLFCTGAQILSALGVESITETSATVRWDANVIGTGLVALGAGQTTVTDPINNTAHAIQINNLTAGTQYQFTASNLHQIDQDVLASATGQFTTTAPTTTPPPPTTFVITEPHAEPRTINAGQASTVSIRAKNQGNPAVGQVVTFAIAAGTPNAGGGTLSATQATTDTNGIASVSLTGTARGLVDVQASSPNATNTGLKIPVVVK